MFWAPKFQLWTYPLCLETSKVILCSEQLIHTISIKLNQLRLQKRAVATGRHPSVYVQGRRNRVFHRFSIPSSRDYQFSKHFKGLTIYYLEDGLSWKKIRFGVPELYIGKERSSAQNFDIIQPCLLHTLHTFNPDAFCLAVSRHNHFLSSSGHAGINQLVSIHI